MRSKLFVPLAAALSLSACGSSEDTREGPISPEDAAEALSNAETPRAGQYRTNVEVLEFDIPGIPKAQQEQMRAMMAGSITAEQSYCLTEAEAENGGREMAKNLAAGDCSFNEFRASGNTLYADMVCKGADGAQGNVILEGTTTRNSSDMTMTMNQRLPGMPGEGSMNMKMHMVSERVGDCTSG